MCYVHNKTRDKLQCYCHTVEYYPTAANTVQISRETSTNIYSELYSRNCDLFAGQVGAYAKHSPSVTDKISDCSC